MTKQYALRLKTEDKYAKLIGFHGGVTPYVVKRNLGTLCEATIFTGYQLDAERKGFTTKELIETHLTDFEIIEVNLSVSESEGLVEKGDFVYSRNVNTKEKEYWTVTDVLFDDNVMKYFDEEGYWHEREDVTLICKAKDRKDI